MRYAISALLTVAALASQADAQTAEGARAAADPRIWISASAGPAIFPQLNFLNDQSRDNVSAGTKFQGSIEYDLGTIGGIGFTYSTIEHPVVLRTNRIPSPCQTDCEATVKLTSMLATLHVGGGEGFEMVFQASAGVTRFGAFEESEVPVGTRGAATDFTTIIGYGASYGFTPALSAMLIADIGLVFHQTPDGEEVEGTSYSPFVGLRAGLRYGLWSRPR